MEVSLPPMGKPILQIVHISDLHFRHKAANPAHRLQPRHIVRQLHKILETVRFFGWKEGTQRHLPKGPKKFEKFLTWWRESDPRWYADKDEAGARTWLVDTGDLTAFGDVDSIALGQGKLLKWAKALGDCEVRSIYGNHDAWPCTLPLYFPKESGPARREIVEKLTGWDSKEWLTSPLKIKIPDTENSWIELYALNTVAWGAVKNTLAIGEVRLSELENLRLEIASRVKSLGSTYASYRVLLCHHPIVFPYSLGQRAAAAVIPNMRLESSEKLVRKLKNDDDEPEGIGPLVHLFLSGHTHASFPSGEWPDNVTEIDQHLLDPLQLQLVGGPLMLANGVGPDMGGYKVHRNSKDYAPSLCDLRGSQAQVLRFYQRLDEPNQMDLVRIPVYASRDGKYIPEAEEIAITTLEF